MKFQLTATLLTTLLGSIRAEETNTDTGRVWDIDGEDLSGIGLHDGTVFNEDAVYDGTCGAQANCLGFTVKEVQRRCGSGSCEFHVCYSTEVGQVSTDVFLTTYMANNYDGDAAAQAVVESCLQHPDVGVDYAGNINADSPDEDTGGCLNGKNSHGKGFWDETCINPETADASTGIVQETSAAGGVSFDTFCQVVAPGHTVHFLMHSYNRLDWNGENPAPVQCSGSAELAASTEPDKWGNAKCAPSQSSSSGNGQTYFPATDGTAGGTCSEEPEGVECVWSYTAPNECRYEENDPTCAISEASVKTLYLCGDDFPVVEYFEHPNNPNDAPPRVPLHNINHNGDGTVSFQIYNPYGNYSEPINYSPGAAHADDYKYGPGGSEDFIDMFVVYDQANEIGNEVCALETAAGKCASDNEYVAKCRSDGVAVVTVFASGFDADSLAAKQVKGDGTEVFDCCPDTYQPDAHFNAATTAAWTFLVHCDCPSASRRHLKESVSAKFQAGELFSENQKKLHRL